MFWFSSKNYNDRKVLLTNRPTFSWEIISVLDERAEKLRQHQNSLLSQKRWDNIDFLFLFFEAILFACRRKYSVGHFGEFLGCRAAVNLCKKSGLPLRRCASHDEPVCKRIAKITRYHIEFLTCFFWFFEVNYAQGFFESGYWICALQPTRNIATWPL